MKLRLLPWWFQERGWACRASTQSLSRVLLIVWLACWAQPGQAASRSAVLSNAPAEPILCVYVNLEKLLAPFAERLAASVSAEVATAGGDLVGVGLAAGAGLAVGLKKELSRGRLPDPGHMHKWLQVAGTVPVASMSARLQEIFSHIRRQAKAAYAFVTGPQEYLLAVEGTFNAAAWRSATQGHVESWGAGFKTAGPPGLPDGCPTWFYCADDCLLISTNRNLPPWRADEPGAEVPLAARWPTFVRLSTQGPVAVVEGDLEKLDQVWREQEIPVPPPLNQVSTFRFLLEDDRYKVQFYSTNPEVRTIILQVGKSLPVSWQQGGATYGNGDSVFVTGNRSGASWSLGPILVGALVELAVSESRAGNEQTRIPGAESERSRMIY